MKTSSSSAGKLVGANVPWRDPNGAGDVAIERKRGITRQIGALIAELADHRRVRVEPKVAPTSVGDQRKEDASEKDRASRVRTYWLSSGEG